VKANRTLVTVLVAALILVLFAALSMALADSETQLARVASEFEIAQATILEISIPDFPLQKHYSGSNEDDTRGRRTLDLWSYTTYDDDPTALVYQATDLGETGYLAFELVSGHFLSMTVMTHIKPRNVNMQVVATDGTLVNTDTFTVTIAPGPYIDFYDVYGGYPLDDPLVVYAGGGLEEPLDLDYYSGNKAGDSIKDQTFSVVNSVPASLGITIYTDPSAGPFECENCLDIRPTREAIGAHQVEIQIENSYGLTATDTLNVQVRDRVFLPVVLRNR
jgi:hypothetical protein